MPLPPQRPAEASPQAVPAPEGAQTHPLGHILTTATAGVGILVEPAQRRVVATAAFSAGATVMRFEGRASDTPTRYSVQIGPAEHLDPFDLLDEQARLQWRSWMFLNHSCEPNAAVRDRSLVALRDIADGEGITFDYNATEWDMAEPFACHCGSPRCVGLVRGARHRPPTRP